MRIAQEADFEAERFPELCENVARHSDGEWWEV